MNIKRITDLLQKAEKRNKILLHLTPNENQISMLAANFLSSRLSDRYFFKGSDPDFLNIGSFLVKSSPDINFLIERAENISKKLLNAEFVNLSFLSGLHAMLSVFLATTKPGDKVMTIKIKDGGHFATSSILKHLGRHQIYASYDNTNKCFDVELISRVFKREKVKVLYLDMMINLSPINLSEIRRALGDDAIIIYDASHPLGLIMGGQFQSPLREGADIISANTHKTFPGPHRALLAFKDGKYAEKINKIIDGKFYSSVHMGSLMALVITIFEIEKFGNNYARQIIKNSNSLGSALIKRGVEVFEIKKNKYSDNHQLHLRLRDQNCVEKSFKNFINNDVSINMNKNRKRDFFIRLGTQEITRRGMKEGEMENIAEIISKSLKGNNAKFDVAELNKRFKNIDYSFDNRFNEF